MSPIMQDRQRQAFSEGFCPELEQCVPMDNAKAATHAQRLLVEQNASAAVPLARPWRMDLRWHGQH